MTSNNDPQQHRQPAEMTSKDTTTRLDGQNRRTTPFKHAGVMAMSLSLSLVGVVSISLTSHHVDAFSATRASIQRRTTRAESASRWTQGMVGIAHSEDAANTVNSNLNPFQRAFAATRMLETDTFMSSSSSADGGTGSGGSSLLAKADFKSQLFNAFTALDVPDQYDAVLTGLCAKILDQRDLSEAGASAALQDPMQLLQEMNDRRIAASPRSLMALVDSTVKTQNAVVTSQVLSLCIRNGAIQQYGAQQADIIPLPTSATSKVRCPDGTWKTRQDRLNTVADIPYDDRVKEVAYATAFAGLVAACGILNLAGMDDIAPYANTCLTAVVTVGVLDNFYDVVRSASNFAVQQVKKSIDQKTNSNNSETNKNDNTVAAFQLPDKESLPFGLGTGQWTGSTVRGLNRLFTIDAERQAECDAAALFAAYALALPCFAYRPNAKEAADLTLQDTTLLGSTGVLRMLIWLMAPVAMESSKHAQVILSDPREGRGYLQRLEQQLVTLQQQQDDNVNNSGINVELLQQACYWLDPDSDPQERDDLLKWAYTEADVLLRINRETIVQMARNLQGGASTVGDCVAVLERW